MKLTVRFIHSSVQQLLKRPNVCQKIAKRNYDFLPYGTTSKLPINRFRALPDAAQNAFLTYLWIDGTGENLRSKMKVIKNAPTHISEIPVWNYDGSSTYQAKGHDSDMTLAPVAMVRNPFHPGNSKLVLCDVYDGKGNPASTNHRIKCLEACKKVEDKESWFGFEQEYTFLGTDRRPLGFPPEGFPAPQGPYYCSVGAGRSAGRDIAEAHLYACMYSGLTVGGTNAEVLLGQWEYQVGPCLGISAADEIWFSRYILSRVAEEFGVAVTLDPKPIEGDWNGTGNHVNFSTNQMREDGGLKYIWESIEKLSHRHKEHIEAYDPHGGADNIRRLTGLHETAKIDEFSAAEAARNVSIRIPRPVADAGKGWMEDRRPSANCDPYQVIERILRTCFLE